MSLYYDKKLVSGVRDIPSMTLAQYNALTNKPKLWIRTDAPDSDRGINADDIEYDNGVSVKEAIDGVSVLKINANTYSTWGQALTALGTAWEGLTQAQKERSYLIYDGRLKLSIQDMTNSNRCFTWIAVGGNSINFRSMYIASTPYYLVATQAGSSQTITNNTTSAQTESIELKY